MTDVWRESNGDIVVSLKTTKPQRAQNTEYGDTDLASGYPSNQIWTTKDGRRIAIPNLSDNHLLNIIAYLRRRSEDYRKMVIAQMIKGVIETTFIMNVFDVPPDLELRWDEEIKRMEMRGHEIFNMPEEALLRKVVPIYSKLLQECYRRKLLLEVDKTKLDQPSNLGPTEIQRRYQPKPKPKPTAQPKARLKSKPKNTPQDWHATIDVMRQAAIDYEGIEVHRDDWPAAEHIVKNEPYSFNLGPARGPDNAWKRLYYNEDSND